MPRINPARRVILSKEERALLRQWTLAGHAPRQLAARAQMVLAEEQGKSRRQIARELQMASGTVRKWCTRFATAARGAATDHRCRGTGHPYPDSRRAVRSRQPLHKSSPGAVTRRFADGRDAHLAPIRSRKVRQVKRDAP